MTGLGSQTAEEPAGNRLHPNLAHIRDHLEALFGEPGDLYDGLIEIAHGKRGPDKAKLFSADDLDAAAAYAAKINEAREVVYVGAALRNAECKRACRTKKQDFYGATTVWCDIDDAKAVAASKARCSALPPTHCVVTGRVPHPRIQMWWMLDEPITSKERLEILLRGIRNTVGGDPAVVDCIRVMRLAGTVAWPTKKGRVAELTELRTASDDPVSTISLWSAYSGNAEKVDRPASEYGNGTNADGTVFDGDPEDHESLRSVLLDKETNRFDLDRAKSLIRPGLFYPVMTHVTAHLVGKGVPEIVILDMGLQWGRERLRSEFNEDDARKNLKRQIEGARAKGWGPDWKQALMRSAKGRVLGNIENAMTALEQSPEWRGVLWMDQFAKRLLVRSPPPWQMDQAKGWAPRDFGQHEDAMIAGWLQRYGGVQVGHDIAGKAAATVAEKHGFNPVIDYLDALEWDGERRIAGWLVEYFGADPNNEVEIEFGRRWLIAAVARIYTPGCKSDCILVLEGVQGIGKSSGLRFLVPNENWFTDHMPEVHSKDAMIQVQGKWIVEMAELEAFSRSEITRVKAYLSRTTDDFRPPYGRGNVRSPRSCVFAGTTNRGAYLIDDTGNRRFWTVTCHRVNVRKIMADRDQLWAEAVAEFKSGEKWWIADQSLQAKATAGEAERLDVIESWLEELRDKLGMQSETSVYLCLTQHLGFRRDQITKRDEAEVARCLKVLGLEKVHTRNGKRWVKPDRHA